MNTREVIDRIFKEPGVQFELTEFENLGRPIHEILSVYPKVATTGKDAGKTKYYLKSLIPFSTGNEEVQVHAEGGKSAPEEIVRQLWVYKLMHQYGYHADEIDLEKGVQFGTEIGTKAADIIVYTDATKLTPKIIVECKKPKRKDGIEQLKSYMNAKGAPVAVWSNGADSIILYRPYPAQFDDTLFDIPKRGQAPRDVLEASKTLLQLKKDFNFKKIIQDLDYPIFMAVSERGGKDNSGDYKHLLDEQGSLVEFPDGHPQEGQLVVDQDLVNYDLRAEDLADATRIPDDIRIQSNYQTHFIYFDYKGDVVDNTRFLEVARVQPFRLLQGGQNLPINPFILPAYDEQTINVSAREKAESFASINSKLGPVQKGALTEAIRAAYAKRAGSAAPYPDFPDVLGVAVAAYEEDGKKDDSLIEVLRDLSDFDLFWRHGNEAAPMDRVANRTMLIDVHAMPVLKELVAYLVIERLYKEMTTLPESPVTEGRRTIRTILVIDEAHNYLSQKNMFLQRIIREGRSKGVVVFFASQSPNDYQQKFFDFQQLLSFAYIFQCDGVAAGSVQDILGCSAKTARDLQTEIARLEPWQVIARSQEKTEEFVKFTAEAFYKTYA